MIVLYILMFILFYCFLFYSIILFFEFLWRIKAKKNPKIETYKHIKVDKFKISLGPQNVFQFHDSSTTTTTATIIIIIIIS